MITDSFFVFRELFEDVFFKKQELQLSFPLVFPLIALFSLAQLLIEMLHAIGTVMTHFLHYMTIGIQGKLSSCMT